MMPQIPQFGVLPVPQSAPSAIYIIPTTDFRYAVEHRSGQGFEEVRRFDDLEEARAFARKLAHHMNLGIHDFEQASKAYQEAGVAISHEISRHFRRQREMKEAHGIGVYGDD